jgi:hypothetical protein
MIINIFLIWPLPLKLIKEIFVTINFKIVLDQVIMIACKFKVLLLNQLKVQLIKQKRMNQNKIFYRFLKKQRFQNNFNLLKHSVNRIIINFSKMSRFNN